MPSTQPHPCFLNKASRGDCILVLVGIAELMTGVQLPVPTQAQVAYRFLSEVLRSDYPAAYRRLAPEVQRALSSAAFVTAAQPLQQLVQQRGSHIKLYKLGTRLSGRGKPGQWFYSFSFAKDSLLKPPPMLLEVTFRDTATRQVLGFGVRRY